MTEHSDAETQKETQPATQAPSLHQFRVPAGDRITEEFLAAQSHGGKSEAVRYAIHHLVASHGVIDVKQLAMERLLTDTHPAPGSLIPDDPTADNPAADNPA